MQRKWSFNRNGFWSVEAVWMAFAKISNYCQRLFTLCLEHGGCHIILFHVEKVVPRTGRCTASGHPNASLVFSLVAPSVLSELPYRTSTPARALARSRPDELELQAANRGASKACSVSTSDHHSQIPVLTFAISSGEKDTGRPRRHHLIS